MKSSPRRPLLAHSRRAECREWGPLTFRSGHWQAAP